MKKEASRLKRISVQRRIMLQLIDHQKHVDSYEVPEEVTQAGIAAEHGLRQNHVSRALAEMTSDGIIFSRTSHIKGAPRRKKVYFLTQNGLSEVNEYIQEISNKGVLVRTPSRELVECTLEKAGDYISDQLGHSVSYHRLLTDFYDGNEIDLVAAGGGCEGKPAYSALDARLDRPFYGRGGECAAILDAIEESNKGFIVISSMAGQGKTALLTKVVSSLNERTVFWTTLNEWVHQADLLNDWGDFLKGLGKSGLYDHLDNKGARPKEALSVFLKSSRSLNPVVVVDDFHKATEDVVELFRLLKTLLKPGDGPVFLIASRTKPGFYGKKDILVSRSVLELELGGLDTNSALSILKEKGIGEEHFEKAYEITQGHPLALELFNPEVLDEESDPNLEFNAFLGEEVVRDLRPVEIDVLNLASVFSTPVHPRAFFFRKEISQHILDDLSKRLVLRAFRNGTYDIHELLKSYFLSRMSEFEKGNYLYIACDYYSTRGSEKDMLEHLRLLRESGQKKELLAALLENGEYLYSQGHTLQITEYAGEIDEDRVKGLNRVRLMILKSDIAVGENRLPYARNLLKKGLKICDNLLGTRKGSKEDAVRQVSRIYTRSAEISRLEGRMDETLKTHKQSVKLNRKYTDKAGEGKALNNLAVAYRERGELDQALETLESAREIFQQLGDTTASALVEVNIGDIYLLKRDFKNSRKHFRTAQETSTKYLPAKGIILKKIGNANLRTGDLEAASGMFRQALAAYRETGDIKNRIGCLNDLFKCACKQKDGKGAKEQLRASRELIDAYAREYTDSPSTPELRIEHLKNRMVYCSVWERKGLLRASREYIDLVIRTKDLRLVLDHLDELALEVTDRKALLALYTDLGKVLKTQTAKQPYVIVTIKKASLLLDIGMSKQAKADLKQVHPLAKRIGFKKAVKRIEEMLK